MQVVTDETLLERFPITMADGTTWRGELHRGRLRRGGRRILVWDLGGVLLFDSGDCYDFANAHNAVCRWLFGQPPAPLQ